MKIGLTATYKKSFTQEEFNRFAALSGDDNPIHIDPEFSKRTKFGNTVAHGMLLYSTIGRSLGALLPGSGTLQISQELMFPNPTFVGQEVTIYLEVTELPTPETALIRTNIIQLDKTYGCQGESRVWLPGSMPSFEQVSYTPPDYHAEARQHRGLNIGDRISQTKEFGLNELNEFCELVSEENSVILDSVYAQSIGLHGTPLPGGLLGATVSDILGTKLPGRGTNWLKQKFYFLAPAYPGEEITTSVEIIRLRPEKDLVNLRTTLTNTDGEIVLDGEALVWISDLEIDQ